jgi:hypothetical protein
MARCFPAKSQVLEFKVGDTVMFGCQALGEDGEPASIVGVTVTSEVRDEQGDLVCLMGYVPVDPDVGSYELWAPDDIVWTPGNKLVDIQYTSTLGGRVVKRSTETFWLRMIQDITQS